LNSVYFISEK